MSALPPQSTTAAGPSDVEAHAKRFLTIPNLLSLSRALLAIPFLLVMLSSIPSATLWGCLLVGIAALTDKLDGLLARKYHQTTEWGRILDPLADKFGIGVGMVALLLLDMLPLWFAAVVFGRDLLILAGGMYLKSTRGIVLPSNEAGKWTVGLTVLTVFLLLVGLPFLVTATMMGLVVVMVVVSFGLYLSRFIDVVKNHRITGHGTV